MDSTGIIVGIIGVIINYLIIYFIIKSAIINSRQAAKSSEMTYTGHVDFIRVLSVLSRTALCSKNELMILSNVNESDLSKCIEFLKVQNHVLVVDDQYFITEKGLGWIRSFDPSEPKLKSDATESIMILKYIYENLQGKKFRARDLVKAFPSEEAVADRLLFLAKRGFLVFEIRDASTKEYNEYKINQDKDGHYLFS